MRTNKRIPALLGATICLALLGALAVPATVSAQTYPTKNIRFIVTVLPGGGADILARTFGGKLHERFGVPVVVENITGASGLQANQAVQRAPADGHTIIINASSTYNATMYTGKVGNPRTALAPVAQLTSQPLALIANNDLPIRNMQDLVAYGKKNRDGLAFASPGIGTSSHLIGEIINTKTGINLVHIPYKGIAAGILDAIAGRIQLVFTSPTSAGPHVRSGKLRMIAHSSPKRTQGMPDVPTMIEQGVDVDWSSWFGIFTTYGSPRANVLALNNAINQIAVTPEIQKFYAADGADSVQRTPEQFGETVFLVLDTGAKIIKDLGLKMDE